MRNTPDSQDVSYLPENWDIGRARRGGSTAEELHERWMKNEEYREAYEAQEEEAREERKEREERAVREERQKDRKQERDEKPGTSGPPGLVFGRPPSRLRASLRRFSWFVAQSWLFLGKALLIGLTAFSAGWLAVALSYWLSRLVP